MHQAGCAGVQEDRRRMRYRIRHHGIHRLHREAGVHPDQQYHRGNGNVDSTEEVKMFCLIVSTRTD